MVKTIKLSREEKASIVYDRLLRAAAQAISERGFVGASIAFITGKAKVSTGSFYTYFESRESLFQTIILNQGNELQRQIASAVAIGASFFEREELSLRQYFRFIRANPSFIRLLNEAETFLPDTYKEITGQIKYQYRKALVQAFRKGQIRPLRKVEIDGVVLFMLSARHYFGQQFLPLCNSDGEVPDRIVAIYMRFVRGGLERSPAEAQGCDPDDTSPDGFGKPPSGRDVARSDRVGGP